MEKEVESMSTYNILANRKIESCNPNIHHKGLIHPKRTMRIHDFLYCAEGKWEIFIDNKPYILNKDDILILHAGVEHYGKEPCLPETKVYFIHIFPEDGDSYSEKSHNNSSPNLVVCDPLIHCQNFPEIKRLFKEIIQTYWSSLPQSACKCSVLIQMLLIRLSECEQKHSFDKEIALTESCINIISQSSHFFLKPKEMAKSLFVSERTLRNAFKKVYNTTPYHYQRDMKLKRSIALMKEYPELTMNEIAINLGFADESHFCKVFKQIYGISPTTYKITYLDEDEIPDIVFCPVSENDVVWPVDKLEWKNT